MVLWGCSESRSGLETFQPGTYEQTLDLRVYGFRRSYLLHIPQGYNQTSTFPLVVALHGGFGTAQRMERETGLSALADRERFLVLYPNGMTLFGWLQHWNAIHCCGKAMEDGLDDVGFISMVIDQVRKNLKVNPARIYLLGYSNGGMLVHCLGAQKPETFAALAVLSASVGSRPSPSEPEVRIPSPRGSVPVIAFHGREDNLIPYGGGRRKNWGHLYVSVKESMDFWVQANRCASIQQKEQLLAGKVLKETWRGEKRGEVVTLYTLEGWKHNLPTRYFTQGLPSTDPLKGFHATDIIWEFFKSHHR